MIRSVVDVALPLPAEDAAERDVTVIGPDGVTAVRPVFVDDADAVRVRFRADQPGRYRLGFDGGEVEHEVSEAQAGDPPAPRVTRDGRHLMADGQPFFWMADTWWFALCDRVRTPELAALADQRVEQGYSVVHVVAGLLPEVEAFEDLGELVGRWPWQAGFTALDPAWWAAADERIELITSRGLVPAIVGSWSYYLLELGVDRMVRHWREVIARWGAHPVVWCIAGEAGLPNYADLGTPAGEDLGRRLIDEWQIVFDRVAALDGYGSVRTIHPFPLRGLSSTEMLHDPTHLDLVWLQTGHSSYHDIEPTLAVLEREAAAEHGLPVVNSEVCYEGIGGGSDDGLQRFLFWTQVLRGAAGHSYGAQGLWAFRRAEDRGPGLKWGSRTWQQAAALPGGTQLGWAASFLRTLDWGRLRPAGVTARPQGGAGHRGLPYVARSADTVLAYLPATAVRGPGTAFRGLTIDGLGDGWTGRFVDPRTGADGPSVQIEPAADGAWTLWPALVPTMEDWLLLLRRDPEPH